ncbi:MAG: hypothetical protein HZA14_06505 [Nitrospirae bacterium]|nr:hypothetical protein [Nitrospirota bacterium]
MGDPILPILPFYIHSTPAPILQSRTGGFKEGLLNYPSQMCINDNGDVFIADTNNNRVQIFMLVK